MSTIARKVRSPWGVSLGVAVLLVAALDVTVGETPAFAVPPQESSPAGAVDRSVASLSGSGLIIEIDGVWYVDGASVAAAAAGLRTVNSSQVGYDRDLFEHWSDPDGNGCDARNDILQRDLTNIALRAGDGCVVERGTLTDPYTGDVIPFTRGVATSGAVHIDHIVPLAAAWTGGANTWDAAQREAFANDPMNLQAVDGRANSAKGSRLASEWMPPNAAFHCTYLAQMTSVLAAYDLAVTPIDQNAIINGGIIDGVTFAGATACALPAEDEPTQTPSVSTLPSQASRAPSASPSVLATPAPALVTPETDAERSSEAEAPGDRVLLWTVGLAGAALIAVLVAHARHRP